MRGKIHERDGAQRAGRYDREYVSRRMPQLPFGRYGKRQTHRHERREGHRLEREAVVQMQVEESWYCQSCHAMLPPHGQYDTYCMSCGDYYRDYEEYCWRLMEEEDQRSYLAELEADYRREMLRAEEEDERDRYEDENDRFYELEDY